MIKEQYQKEGFLHITGVGLSRSVSLFGETLDIEKSRAILDQSTEFNWGYKGQGPAQLALAILLELLPEKEALAYYQTFKAAVISQLPQTDFDVKVRLVDIMSPPITGKPFHIHNLIKVKIDGKYLYRFMDFSCTPYRTGIFASDTVEYELLTEMITAVGLNLILKKQTTRTEPPKVTEVCTQLIYDPEEDEWILSKGMGRGTYRGTVKSDVRWINW